MRLKFTGKNETVKEKLPIEFYHECSTWGDDFGELDETLDEEEEEDNATDRRD